MVLIHRKPSSHAGPRPEEETPHRLARTKSKLKVRAKERRQQVQVFLENIAAVFLVVALCAFLFTITSKSAVHSEEENRSVTLVEAEDNYVQEPLPTSYQCALVWVRIPKTASTTVRQIPFNKRTSFFTMPHVASCYFYSMRPNCRSSADS